MSLFDIIRRKVGQQHAEDLSLLPAPPSPSTLQDSQSESYFFGKDRTDEDDAWSDVTSEGEPGSTTTNQNANGAASLDTQASLEDDVARFLPYSTHSTCLPETASLTT
jgi:hypothetical protein